MSDALIDLGLNEHSKSPAYLKGYNDYHQVQREADSLSIVRNAAYQPPAGEERQYAAGWAQAMKASEQTKAEQAAHTAAALGLMS